MRAKSIQELRELPEDTLIGEHDRQAERTGVGIDYYLDELKRRQENRHDTRILWLTVAVFILTFVEVVFFVYEVVT